MIYGGSSLKCTSEKAKLRIWLMLEMLISCPLAGKTTCTSTLALNNTDLHQEASLISDNSQHISYFSSRGKRNNYTKLEIVPKMLKQMKSGISPNLAQQIKISHCV